MGFGRKANGMKNTAVKYMAKYALIFAGVFIATYYFILQKRVELGYFEYPMLTTLSELNWFLIGVSLAALFGVGAGAAVSKRKKKKRK